MRRPDRAKRLLLGPEGRITRFTGAVLDRYVGFVWLTVLLALALAWGFGCSWPESNVVDVVAAVSDDGLLMCTDVVQSAVDSLRQLLK